MYLYRKALRESLFKGRSIRGIVCASVYYACRSSKIPLTISEISEKLNCPERKIKLNFSKLIKILKLKSPLISPEIYIPKYCRELKLPYEIETQTILLLQKTPHSFFNGKNPRTCIGGLIYYTCKNNSHSKTQVEIAEVTETTDVSIRSRYRELKILFENNL